MRVYLPATQGMLRALDDAGEVGRAPVTCFAVTPALREWYAEGNAEELEYAAFTQAARASLRLLDADPASPRRRVVVAADVPDASVTLHPELDRAVVRVAEPVRRRWVAALHVDGPEAEDDVARAAAAILEADLGDDDAQFTVDSAEGHDLQWYAPQELAHLTGNGDRD